MSNCDFPSCLNLPVRVYAHTGCCMRRWCLGHLSHHDDVCSFKDDDAFFDARNATDSAELMELEQRIDDARLVAIASSLRDNIPCSIPAFDTSKDDRPSLSEMMGGLNAHVIILFEDGVKWIVRLKRSISVSPPQTVEDCILVSEYSTFAWLNSIGVPTATVHGYGLASDPDGVGVNYILMDEINGSPLEWHELSPDKRRHLFVQLADVYLKLEHHPFSQGGSIYLHGTAGPLADSLLYKSEQPGHVDILGPFTSMHDYLTQTTMTLLHLISTSQWAVGNPVASYLTFRSLLDLYPRLFPKELLDGTSFYLRHVDDKGDHILVNDHTDIVGIIDWEWSKLLPKPFAFSSPMMLWPPFFDGQGVSTLSPDEEDFASIFDSLERPDMASYIRNGRVCQGLLFLFTFGYDENICMTHLGSIYRSAGEKEWQWETWQSEALQKYQTDSTLQRLKAIEAEWS